MEKAQKNGLLESAQHWRNPANEATMPEQKRLYEATARSLEKQAETGISVCVCCGKPFGKGLDF